MPVGAAAATPWPEAARAAVTRPPAPTARRQPARSPASCHPCPVAGRRRIGCRREPWSAYGRQVDVTFTKETGSRYTMAVHRETGPVLAASLGPGRDEYLPHDLVHFVVEVEAGLIGGVFGRVAAGGRGSFWPVSIAERRRASRDRRRPTPQEHTDMARSEELASICAPLWDLRHGRRAQLPDWFSQFSQAELEDPVVHRVLARLDDVAPRWHALEPGQGITLVWPAPRPSTSARANRGI